MVQKLGKKEPQVKKTSCLQQILNRTGFLHLIFKIGTVRHKIGTFLHWWQATTSNDHVMCSQKFRDFHPVRE